MPGFDGTGPQGLGPRTGRGLGPCMGRAGRGFARRRFLRQPITEIEDKEFLEQEMKALETELNRIREKLKSM